MKDIITRGAKTVPARNFLAGIAKLQEAIKNAHERGASSKFIDTLQNEGKLAIMRDLRAAQANERERLQGELEKERIRTQKDYLKDLAYHDFQVKAAERRFYGMTEQELSRTALAYCEGSANIDDQYVLEALSAALVDRVEDASINEQLRHAMVENKYDQPHLRTETGQALQREIEINQLVSGGGVLLVDDTGNSFGVSYDEVFEALAPVEAEPSMEADHE